MIELKQLNKTYHVNTQSFHALKDINLTIGRGEILAF